MKKFLFLLLLASGFTRPSSFAQSRIIRKLTDNKKDSTRAASFLPLPAIGYAQETGWEFGLVALYSFYTDRLDTLTRNSSINAKALITTKGQSEFDLKSDIWTLQNKYHYTSEIRFKNFPFDFYGLGNETLESNKNRVDQNLTRIFGEVERAITKKYYLGINANFESYTYKDKAPGGIYQNEPLQGKDGGNVLFFGLSQIFDNRNTNTYTTKGHYLKLNYSYAPDFFGGDNFRGNFFKADFRTFGSLNKNTVLAFNIFYSTVQGKNIPFYLLPQLGNDQFMRGYYTGRYRAQNYLTSQLELRYRFIPRLGVATFAGAGNIYNNRELDMRQFKPSYGAGLRYFFDLDRDLSIRFDYGVGEKRPGEKRQTGFYISAGEAF